MNFGQQTVRHSLRAIFLGIALFGQLLLANPVVAEVCATPLNVLRYPNRSGDGYTCYDNLLRQLLADARCAINFQDLGFTTSIRRQKMLDDGAIDIAVGLSKNAERERTMNFSIALGSNQLQFFALKNQTQWHRLSQPCDATMASARLLLPEAGYYGPVLEKIRTTSQCAKSIENYSEGPNQALQMLARDRADIFVATNSWWHRASDDAKQALDPIVTMASKSTVHLAYDKNRVPARFIQQIDERIQTLLKQIGPPCGLDTP